MSKLVLNKYSPDKKDFSVLLSFLVWLVIGFIVCFIGINDIFAATYNMNYEYLQKYYDNNGSTVTAVTTNWNESLQSYVSNNITTIPNSYGAGLSITSPIPLIANHTYTLSVYFDGISNITKSSKNNIAISTSLTGAASNYANNNFYVDMIQTNVSNNNIIQFVFTTKGGGNYIFFPWTTTSKSTHSYVLTQISIEDLGSEGISQQDINNSLNNQTNDLNNSIQNSTNIITGEIDDMEQNIIDSNKETQDVIKDQFNTCRDSINLWGKLTWQTSTYAYSKLPKEKTYYTLSIRLKEGKTIPSGLYIGFTEIGAYSISQVTKWLIQNGEFVTNQIKDNFYYINNQTSIGRVNYISVFPPNNMNSLSEYFDIQLEESQYFTTFEQYGEKICSNKIDETNDKLNDLNSNITNDNIDNNNVSNSFNEFENFIDENATISTLITLPVILFSSILNGLQSSCVPFNLGSLYGADLVLPCINLGSYLGSTLWTMIDVIISGFAIYFISKKFIKVFNNFSSMKEGDVIDD